MATSEENRTPELDKRRTSLNVQMSSEGPAEKTDDFRKTRTDLPTASDDHSGVVDVQETCGIQESLKEGQELCLGSDPPPKVPPDGGWGWLVAFGGALNIFLTTSVIPCFSILFYETLVGFGASSLTIAWIYNIHMFMWNIFGSLVMPLVTEFGWRKVGAIGILCITVALVISSFATSTVYLFFSFSFISGAGCGLNSTLCFNIIPLYFLRRRGAANAIAMASIAMGQIIGPPFVRYLQYEYSSKGALLLVSAIVLNGLVGVCFFHPVEWHLKQVPAEEETDPLKKESEPSLVINLDQNDVSKESSEKVHKLGEDEGDVSESKYNSDMNKKERLRKRTISVTSYHSLSSATEIAAMFSSSVNGKSSRVGNADESDEQDSNHQKSGSCILLTILARVARSIRSDMKIMKSRRAIIINVGIMLILNTHVNFVMTFPFALRAAGFTLEDASIAISITGICNLVTRLCISPLSDYKWFNMRLVFNAGQIIIASVLLVIPFLEDLKWIFVLSGMYGFGLGINVGFNFLIMIKYMGVENYGATLGASSIFLAMGYLTFGPLIGMVRDITNSYAVSIWALSFCAFSSFLLWLLMPAAIAYDRKRQDRKSES